MANILEQIKGMSRKEQIKRAVVLIVLSTAIYYAAMYGLAWLNRDKIDASGTIEAIEISVASKVQGRVDSFLADEGDVLNKGSIIASLEASELSASLDQAKAIEKSAAVRLENAQRTYKRGKSLQKKRMISDQEFDTIRSAYEAADADFSRAVAARKLAEIAFNESTIKAPINGTILTKVADTGDLLAPFATVVTMADLTNLDIMLYVAETKYGKIMINDYVEISVDSYPGKTFKGKVISIANKAEFTPKNIQTKEERTTQVFGIKVRIPNPDGRLKPGMPADAVIFLNTI